MNETLTMVFIALAIMFVAAVFVIILDVIVVIVLSLDKATALNSTNSMRLTPYLNIAENIHKRQCFKRNPTRH